MQESRNLSVLAAGGSLAAAAAALLAASADLGAWLLHSPAPPFTPARWTHVLMGGAIAVTCISAACGILSGARQRGPTAVQLLAAGLLLAAWRLRGHPTIPPDPPLIAAEVLGAVMLLAAQRWGAARFRRHADGVVATSRAS
jgi:hypothetical protein